MDTNTALFQLKKVEKTFTAGKPCGEQSVQAMVDIRRYLISMKMNNTAERLHEVMPMLKSRTCHLKSLASRIRGIMADLKKNNSASEITINSESKYDLIFAPTQGGYHYCVVSEVSSKNYVRCYPMTTKMRL